MTTQSLSVLYLDKELAVVDKPGGLLAVPGRGPDKQDCVVSRLRQMVPWCIEQPAVHRLDMDTAGVMVLGLTGAAHRHLSRQFAERRVGKQYLALLEGVVSGEKGEICLAFRLDPDNRPHQVYDSVRGKMGVSHWRRIEIRGQRTLVEFIPQTGRTHQLRLHASHPLGLGCPIVGDRLYGAGRDGDSLKLHATRLHFLHPATYRPLEFVSRAPFDWRQAN